MPQSRTSPVPILKSHFGSFRGANRKKRNRDVLEQVVFPLASGTCVTILKIELSEATSAGILAITGVASAFCFQLGVQLLDRAANWAENRPEPGSDTTRYASLIEELSANTMYAAYVAGLAGIAAFSAGVTDEGWPERTLVCAAAVLTAHFLVTLMLVMVRVFLLTRARLNIARTGIER